MWETHLSRIFGTIFVTVWYRISYIMGLLILAHLYIGIFVDFYS